MGCKSDRQDHRLQRHVPAILVGQPRPVAEGSGEPPTGARAAFSLIRRAGARPGAGNFRTAGGEDRRTIGEAVPTSGVVEGTSWRRRLQAGEGRESVSADSIHVLEASRRATGDDDFRLAWTR